MSVAADGVQNVRLKIVMHHKIHSYLSVFQRNVNYAIFVKNNTSKFTSVRWRALASVAVAVTFFTTCHAFTSTLTHFWWALQTLLLLLWLLKLKNSMVITMNIYGRTQWCDSRPSERRASNANIIYSVWISFGGEGKGEFEMSGGPAEIIFKPTTTASKKILLKHMKASSISRSTSEIYNIIGRTQ